MNRHIAWIALVITLLGADAAPDAVSKEMEAIQGTWVLGTAEQDGKVEDLSKKTTIVIQGNQFTTKVADAEVRRGTLALNPNQTPKAIDLTYADGPQKGQ